MRRLDSELREATGRARLLDGALRDDKSLQNDRDLQKKEKLKLEKGTDVSGLAEIVEADENWTGIKRNEGKCFQ